MKDMNVVQIVNYLNILMLYMIMMHITILKNILIFFFHLSLYDTVGVALCRTFALVVELLALSKTQGSKKP